MNPGGSLGYRRPRRANELLRVTAVHGTAAMYTRGCACSACFEAHCAAGFNGECPAEELRSYWLTHLPAWQARVLELLLEDYPRVVPHIEVAWRTPYALATCETSLAILARRNLVERIRGVGARASWQLVQAAKGVK